MMEETLRELDLSEVKLVLQNGILPQAMRVHYRSDYALHLRNTETGSEIILYLGVKA